MKTTVKDNKDGTTTVTVSVPLVTPREDGQTHLDRVYNVTRNQEVYTAANARTGMPVGASKSLAVLIDGLRDGEIY